MKNLLFLLIIVLAISSCNDKNLVDDLPEGDPPVELTELDAVLNMVGNHQDSLLYEFGYRDTRAFDDGIKTLAYRTDRFKLNALGGSEYERREAVFTIGAQNIVTGAVIRPLGEGRFYDPNAKFSEVGRLQKNKGLPLSTIQSMYAGVDGFSYTSSGMQSGEGHLVYKVRVLEETYGGLKYPKRFHHYQYINDVIINCWIEDPASTKFEW